MHAYLHLFLIRAIKTYGITPASIAIYVPLPLHQEVIVRSIYESNHTFGEWNLSRTGEGCSYFGGISSHIFFS